MNFATITYAIATLTCLTCTFIFGSKIGQHSGRIYPFILFQILPYLIAISATRYLRGDKVVSLMILFGTSLVSLYGLYSIYEAFYRVPQKGGQLVFYNSITQTVLILLLTFAGGGLYAFRKKRNDRKGAGS